VIIEVVRVSSLELLDYASLLSIFLLAVFCSIYGNRWYYKYVCQVIARVRRLGMAEEAAIPILMHRGGVSPFAVLYVLLR